MIQVTLLFLFFMTSSQAARILFPLLFVVALLAIFIAAATYFPTPSEGERDLAAREEVSSEDAEDEDASGTDDDSSTDEDNSASEDDSIDDDSSGSATGDGVDDFGACDDDAREYCSGFYGTDWVSWAETNGYVSASWKLGLVDCLEENRAYTSDACDASLDRRAELNTDVNTLCAEDRAKYCQGVEPIPGSEPQIDCLKEFYDNLSPECATAVDAHEAAKPAAQQ